MLIETRYGIQERRVAPVRTDVSEERILSIIRVTRITHVTLKLPFLQEPHGETSQKTAFFIVTTVKTSNLTQH
jgi:hypothetical protein